MSVTLWPWRRPICPLHFLVTNPKHIKKPQSHQPEHSHCQADKPMPSEAFPELSGRNKAQHCTPGPVQGSQQHPRPQQPQHTFPALTPKLWGLQQLPWSPQHRLCKCHWTAFLLLIISWHRSENPCAWLCSRPEYRLWLKGSSSSSRAPHWDHKSHIPPGTAFLWLCPNWTGHWIPNEPWVSSYSDLQQQLNPSETHQEIQQDTGPSSQGQSRAVGDGGQGTWVPSVTSWLPTQVLKHHWAPTFTLVLLKHLRRVFRDAPCV